MLQTTKQEQQRQQCICALVGLWVAIVANQLPVKSDVGANQLGRALSGLIRSAYEDILTEKDSDWWDTERASSTGGWT